MSAVLAVAVGDEVVAESHLTGRPLPVPAGSRGVVVELRPASVVGPVSVQFDVREFPAPVPMQPWQVRPAGEATAHVPCRLVRVTDCTTALSEPGTRVVFAAGGEAPTT